ncbi:N-formylglutamate amidohydrolase [Candidatus Woesearchaeota archaeon]|nr:N-formylglutamate amidohydrolase [Candidatus Woesearchaeota archaeon]
MRCYRMVNRRSDVPVFISCEHASKVIPRKYRTFGMRRKELARMPDYYDVGAEALSREIAKRLDARCIIPRYSRMVINLNKPEDHPKLINSVCFGIDIKGNKNISDRNERIRKYYRPYHERIKKEVRGKRLYFVSVHSFFHKLGEERKVDIGILYRYKKDEGFCRNIKRFLDKTGLNVKFNQPYSALKTAGYTMNAHGKSKDIRCVEFEVNDKHLKDKKSIKKTGMMISKALKSELRI